MNLKFILSFTKTLSSVVVSKNSCLMRYLRSRNILSIKSLNCVENRFYCSHSLKEDEPEENNESKEKVTFYIKTYEGVSFKVTDAVGETVLNAATKAGADVAGSCCGQLKCTTCHMYVDKEIWDSLEGSTTQEDDMLDKAAFLQVHSRLGCQIKISKLLEGRVFLLPRGTVHFNIDGHISKSH